MRVLSFKLALMMFITSFSIQAQKHKVYVKNFETDKNTTAIFNLENTTIAIETSFDGNVYFDYHIEFENYSKKEISKLLEAINIEAVKFEDNITLKATSITKSQTSYSIDTKNGITLDSDFLGNKNDKKEVFRKSRDSIITEIKDYHKTSIKKFFNFFKTLDDSGNKKDIRRGDVKIIRSQFIIKMPPFVKLTINAKDSQIIFNDDITNELHLVLKNGSFKAKMLANPFNNLKVENATFLAENISGGNYTLNNVSNGLIGSLEKVKIVSEFSKIEIGEIAKETIITDFNSKYWFYNFSTDFKRFDVFSEYSKLKMFYPKLDFSFSAFGNNTIHYVDGNIITMQPSRKGEKFKMMEQKMKGNELFSGHINFDIIHGIIYTATDSLKTINK